MSRCEETVNRYGADQPCGRPLDEHDLCDRPGDHEEVAPGPKIPYDYFVTIPHYWGRGATEEAAIKAMVGAGGKRGVEKVVYHFPPETTRVQIINDYGQVAWWGAGPLSVTRVGSRGKRTDITAEVLGK